MSRVYALFLKQIITIYKLMELQRQGTHRMKTVITVYLSIYQLSTTERVLMNQHIFRGQGVQGRG